MKKIVGRVLLSYMFIYILIGCNGITEQNSINRIYNTKVNKKGPVLGYSATSGVILLSVDGAYFKDLNKNGELDKYEDWRLSGKERAKDLVSQMTNEQIAGLMLYGDHQNLDNDSLTGRHKHLMDLEIRHILIDHVPNPDAAAIWNNNAQAYVEAKGLGIPLNNSSDPRHTSDGSEGINGGAGGQISLWPEGLGMAATFNPEFIKLFGHIAAQEYRALGITTALSPQIDLGTEPRWFRITGSFGEDPQLSADMAQAYIDGFQTSFGKDEIKDGWGYNSVNCMVKHWPGGGPVESGRDAHFRFGKLAVYPGNNFQEHFIPFTEGAFNLKGKTQKASSVMPYYTICFNQDTMYGENVGNSFSKYMITDLLRDKYDYDGVVCTDWHIMGGRKWGVERLKKTERFYKSLMAGVDQIGGENSPKRLLQAFQIGIEEHGEKVMRERIEQSAARLLCNIFQVGLFENPYLNPEASAKIVGNPEFVKKGYKAQLKSIVMLKNKDSVLPVKKDKVVYIPKVYTSRGKDHMGKVIHESYDYPVNIELVKKYFSVTEDASKADVALVFVKGPIPGLGFDRGGEGYIPISLQYGSYTAEYARATSIAPEKLEDPINTNRSYKGKTITVSNSADLKTILDTKKAMGSKPVIVSLALTNPAVVSEFEKDVQGLLVSFGVQSMALLDILSGKAAPSGLLPVQMPANMKTVEEQKEDVPHDMECHIDSEGNKYDFAFGLSWKGVINDSRTVKYKISQTRSFLMQKEQD
ncbi:MAG: glycoside hydrolase family 3 C-terminal domain-containing protein [Labilibaculum sp.]|nr:glycoside hydrolase family 3 C-terminal domain-containing protein [Labilibaculum sp.]